MEDECNRGENAGLCADLGIPEACRARLDIELVRLLEAFFVRGTSVTLSEGADRHVLSKIPALHAVLFALHSAPNNIVIQRVRPQILRLLNNCSAAIRAEPARPWRWSTVPPDPALRKALRVWSTHLV